LVNELCEYQNARCNYKIYSWHNRFGDFVQNLYSAILLF